MRCVVQTPERGHRRLRPGLHRLDESAASYSSAGWSPPEPASASPAESHSDSISRNCKPPPGGGWGIFDRRYEEFSTGVDKRHLPTVGRVTFNFCATLSLLPPAAQLKTMRARIAGACDDFGRRANNSSFCRSSAVISSGLVGRPVRMTQDRPFNLISQAIFNS